MSIDMYDVMDTYLSQNRMHCWEGERGVRNFVKLITDLGYDNNWAGTLNNFLLDNPGAIEAMVEWITERNIPEWMENLGNACGYEEERESDE